MTNKPYAPELVARGLLAYAWLCWRTSRVEIDGSAERVLGATWDRRVPTVFVYWHDEFLLCSLLAYCQRIQYPLCGCNDSFGGRVMAAAWARLGAPIARLPRRASRESKLQLLVRGLLRSRRLVIAADYGQPWFEARPTAWHLAQASQGKVVAIHVQARPAVSIAVDGHQVHIPLPFSRYRLHTSDALPTDVTQQRFVELLGQSLNALRRAAARDLQPSSSPLATDKAGDTSAAGSTRAGLTDG